MALVFNFSYPQSFRFYKKVDTTIPYDPDIENIFWDFSSQLDLIYTSTQWNNEQSKQLKIAHKKLNDDTFYREYILDYQGVGIEKLYITDISFNYLDNVIALIHHRGLLCYEINTNEVAYFKSNPDTAIAEIYYHPFSNAFIAHSLYFYHPHDVKNPERIYQIRYNSDSNQFEIISRPIKYPNLPYTILIGKFLDVDSLIVLSHVLENSFSVYHSNLEHSRTIQLAPQYPPCYHPDSMLHYRFNGPKLLYLTLKKYDKEIERIEKVFTFSDYVLVVVKPLGVIDFNKRKLIISKYDSINHTIDVVRMVDIIYNKKFTWSNFYNFTTSDKIIFRKNYIIKTFVNLNNDFVVTKNGFSIKNYARNSKLLSGEAENNKVLYYSFYVSQFNF